MISIRLKIILLLVATLSTSLLSYLVLGRRLIVEDKTSYIYDATLSHAKTAADAIATRVDRALTISKLIPKALDTTTVTEKQTRDIFSNINTENWVSTFAIFTPDQNGALNKKLQLEDPRIQFSFDLQKMGWNTAAFEKSESLVTLCGDKLLCIGVRSLDSNQHAAVGAGLMELSPSLLKSDNPNILLFLAQMNGSVVLQNTKADFKVGNNELNEMTASQFPTGARDLTVNATEYIASYQQLPKYRLAVVALISKQEAFASARTLVLRSTVMGISILALAIALSWFFARGATQRLRQMWLATQKVSQGDFSVRVEDKKGNDEVTGLAKSFNAMSARIGELLKETATKARMEKELETAQVVQSRFFPHEPFQHKNVRLGGFALAATECGGDWWNYAEVGDYLIVGCGDVTGHGVSSALVTAAAHAAFSITHKRMAEECEAYPNYSPDLKQMMDAMNNGILAAGGGDTQMTLILTTLNLKTGNVSVLNAAHRSPYVWRSHKAAKESHFKKRIDTFGEGRIPPLGTKNLDLITPAQYRIYPGDVILWYTDGLMESENPKGERRNKNEVLVDLDRLSQETAMEPNQLSKNLAESVLSFMGEKSTNLDDDITVAAAIIPTSAEFQTPNIPVFKKAA